MVTIIQGNLSRTILAQDLLVKAAYKRDADLLIISEQDRDILIQSWYSDNLGTAGIWNRNPKGFPVSEVGRGDGFVWVRHADATYVSVYLSPNEGIAVIRQKLEDLEANIHDVDGPIVVAGNFNAKAVE